MRTVLQFVFSTENVLTFKVCFVFQLLVLIFSVLSCQFYFSSSLRASLRCMKLLFDVAHNLFIYTLLQSSFQKGKLPQHLYLNLEFEPIGSFQKTSHI